LTVRPPHHEEEPNWAGKTKMKIREQPAYRNRDRDARQGPFPPCQVLVFRGEVEERRDGEDHRDPDHALICETTFPMQIVSSFIRRVHMPRIVWIVLLIVIFGVCVFPGRYMER